MFHFQPGYKIENREHETLSLSLNEHPPSFKKQRVGEALVRNLMNNPLNGTWNGDDRVMMSQVQVCRMFYYKGKCRYEDRCRFSHVDPEENRDISGKSSRNRTSGFGPFSSKEVGDGRNLQRSVMWKTKLCRNWEMSGGGCPYGKTCYFAHGQAELRKLGRHDALQSRTVPMNVSNTFSTGNDESGTTCKQQKQGMKCTFKWKELEKNIGIYADWIEDLHTSSN